MLKNYVKVALKVFRRHKFFTAVNLFGICLTLVVLMLAAAFIDQEVGPIPPEVHSDRTLHLGWLTVQRDSSVPPGEPWIDWSVRLSVESLEKTREAGRMDRFVPLGFISVISGLMVLMVALGLTGMMWQNVRRRTREIGIRRAVGPPAAASTGSSWGNWGCW